MINWEATRSVFLDMDGTLLDLHYDNHFWLEHVPRRYAEKQGLSLNIAKREIYDRYERIKGTLDWYCVDYWSNQLGLDIPTLKQEVDHLIAVHPHVMDFLFAVRQKGKRITLVTNAHGKSLELKMERTRLGGHFDAIVCAHDLGLPKEDMAFWEKLQTIERFAPEQTLFIDDSLPVLRTARRFGISQLLAVKTPDSQQPEKDVGEFEAIASFAEIIPA